MLFLGFTLTLKPTTAGFLETNRNSVELEALKLPAKFLESSIFFLQEQQLVHQSFVWVADRKRRRGKASSLEREFVTLWLVILMPGTAIAGTGGSLTARKPCLSSRASDTACSWWGTPPPAPATTFCRCRRTLKCRTTSSTASATTDCLAQVTFTCPSPPSWVILLGRLHLTLKYYCIFFFFTPGPPSPHFRFKSPQTPLTDRLV